jgi:hypothetical protein
MVLQVLEHAYEGAGIIDGMSNDGISVHWLRTGRSVAYTNIERLLVDASHEEKIVGKIPMHVCL